jgi:Tol biopolymer transport system component
MMSVDLEDADADPATNPTTSPTAQMDASMDGPEVDASHSCSRAAALQLITASGECVPGNGDSRYPALTDDGSYLVFASEASNLMPGDTNGTRDVFGFDRQTYELERITVTPQGGQIVGHGYTPVVSDNARFVAFVGFSPDLTPEGHVEMKAYVRDRQQGTTAFLPGVYACARFVRMSSDGTLIAWEAYSNCQGGRDPGDHHDVFLYDQISGQSTMIDRPADTENYGPALSPDGNWLAFSTRPTVEPPPTLTSEMMLRSLSQDSESMLPIGPVFNFAGASLSTDGTVLAYADYGQIYRYEVNEDEPRLVSKGRESYFGNGAGHEISISGDGRFIAFASTASNLVENDTNEVADVFLYDAQTEVLQRVSTGEGGEQANDESGTPALSRDGRFLAFASKATNLHPAANNGAWQIYVMDLTSF